MGTDRVVLGCHNRLGHHRQNGEKIRSRHNIYCGIFGTKYLIRSGDSYYSVDGTKLAIAELSAAVFETYGVNTIPTSAVLVTLNNPDVYAWTSGSTAVKLIAAVTANN